VNREIFTVDLQSRSPTGDVIKCNSAYECASETFYDSCIIWPGGGAVLILKQMVGTAAPVTWHCKTGFQAH